jgi:hypothetical protein
MNWILPRLAVKKRIVDYDLKFTILHNQLEAENL